MSFGEYKDYKVFEKKKISSRLRLSKFDNEATRGNLLVSPIISVVEVKKSNDR